MEREEYPLVSIGIPNYNYGKYLANCFDSILDQTYPNIEVIFRDNASTDNSWEVAVEYQKRFLDKGIYFSMFQHKRNMGSDANTTSCLNSMEGNYVYVLASDDAIAPEFIERCMNIFLKFPDVSMVMTNRAEMNDEGELFDIPPFYNSSCVISGAEQAAVFMMAGIAIPGQRMFKRNAKRQVENYSARYQVAGDWLSNFLFTLTNDVAYITEPLCRYRVHASNETSESERNMLGIFEHYRLINKFVYIAEEYGVNIVADRYDEAVRKLGSMCFRYVIAMLKEKRMEQAKQYLNLATIFDGNLANDQRYLDLFRVVQLSWEEIDQELKKKKYNIKREISYNPPEHAILID